MVPLYVPRFREAYEGLPGWDRYLWWLRRIEARKARTQRKRRRRSRP